MAAAGQLKTRIDVLKKKIAEKGMSLPPGRRRRLHKRLKRLQRTRRVAAARETKGKPKPQAVPEAKAEGVAPATKTEGGAPAAPAS